MVDPPHQLDLLDALRLVEESCGGSSTELTTSWDDLEAQLRPLSKTARRELLADESAERLRLVARLR